jgi:hypothetical protein
MSRPFGLASFKPLELCDGLTLNAKGQNKRKLCPGLKLPEKYFTMRMHFSTKKLKTEKTGTWMLPVPLKNAL